ncbi:MAG TPA: hypothetical protein VF723_04930 [Pyrinomonadaceae bacterium]
MKIKRYAAGLAACALLFGLAWTARANRPASDEADVRGVVQRVFEQLRTGQYDRLYEALPSSSRARMSQERFTNALRRTSGVYRLDRMEIGAVRVSGDFAMVETVMYGSVERPIRNEGKIVAQQYLVREGGEWRVATGDRATVRRFLSANPGFARKFAVREPRVFIKRNGRWLDLTAELKAARRAVRQR